MSNTQKADPSFLDLDSLEREGTKAPMTVMVDGRSYQLLDPQEIPWGVLTTLSERPGDFLRYAVVPDDQDAFTAACDRLAAWKINKLAARYQAHYGLPTAGEAAASPRP